MVAWQIWLLLAGFFFILEIATVGFLVFWFGVAALITCILSLFIDNVIIQTAIFVILSTILVLLTRSLANKLTKKDNTVTNAKTIIGKDAIVNKELSLSVNGQIKIDGDTWTAVLDSSYSDTIPVGSIVRVLSIDGVKAVVEPVKIASNPKVN